MAGFKEAPPWESALEGAGFAVRSRDGVPPPKAGVPLLLPSALGLWAAAAVAFLVGRGAAGSALAVVAAVAGLLGAGALAGLWRSRFKLAWALMAGVAVGAALGAAGAAALQADGAWATAEPRTYRFVLEEDASAGEFGLSAKARAIDGQGRSVLARVMVDELAEPYRGTAFSATCQLQAPGEGSADYYWQQGMAARATVRSPEMERPSGPAAALQGLRARAIELIGAHGGPQAPLLQALVCGFRGPLRESGDYDGYKVVGLAHLVAVSGAHLAIVTGVVACLLRALRVPQRASMALLIGFVLAYLVFAGVPISAVRAAAMVALGLLAQGARRRSAALSALALCLMAFVAVDPAASVSVSLFLSAGSTLGIVLFAPLVSSWFAGAPSAMRAALVEPLGLTLASNLVTQPASAALFSQLPLVAPVANVLAAPLFSLGCVAGLVATVGSCAWPSAAPALLGAAGLAVQPLAAVSAGLSAVPFASVPMALPVAPMVALSAMAALALWLAWPRLSLRALGGAAGMAVAAALVTLALAPGAQGNRIVMLDVGQGDAFLLRSGGAAVLVDTGNQDSLLREALGREGVLSLDAVVVTHPDDDHCASLPSLRGVVGVGAVYCAEDSLACGCDRCEGLRQDARAVDGARGLQGLRVGDRLTVGDFALQVLWPAAYADEGGNGDSLCLLATLDADHDGRDDWSALFCGDAEAEQLQALVDRRALGAVDILKVGHHGSRAGLTDELAQVLSPKLALVSAGARNRYGHPTAETLERLEAVGAQVLRTDRQGTVALSLAAEGVSVEVEREG